MIDNSVGKYNLELYYDENEDKYIVRYRTSNTYIDGVGNGVDAALEDLVKEIINPTT